jgi:UTP--glucose-1-phosphate uridylyltransferase
MASIASKALPSHLRPSGLGDEADGGFARKHHGKSQSHVVSPSTLLGYGSTPGWLDL